MYIRRFRRDFEPVPDPLHPSRTVPKPILVPVPVQRFVYTDSAGQRVELEPDKDGGFEVPHDIGEQQIQFRTPSGEAWYPAEKVAEERRLGRLEEPARRGPGRPRKETTEE